MGRHKLSKEKLLAGLRERFSESYRRDDGCWVWTGRIFRGVPRFSVGESLRVALGASSHSASPRRVAYFLKFGHMPKYNLTNACGNCLCIAPEHQNNGDPSQDRNGEIKKRYQAHRLWLEDPRRLDTMERIASEYSMTRQRVEQIVNGAD